MSNARYIEIDSTFRDRTQWPLPGEFVVLISQSGRKGVQDAVDPYSTAAAKTKWSSNNFQADNLTSPSITVSVETTSGTFGEAGDNNTILVIGSPGELQRIEQYYDSAVIVNAAGDRRRITGYRYLGNDRAEITIFSAFPAFLADGVPLIIEDPTDVSSPSYPLFFVPAGNSGSNSYIGCYLYNESRQESRPVAGYDFSTHFLTVDTTGSQDSTVTTGPVTSWLVSDVYSIRRAQPGPCVTLTGTTANTSSFNFSPTTNLSGLRNSFLEKTDILTTAQRGGALTAGTASSVGLTVTSVAVDGFYNGCTIRMTSGAATGLVSTISSYVSAGFVATLTPGFPTATPPAVGNTYVLECPIEARRINKYIDYRASATGGSLSTIEFPTTASSTIGFYNGVYVDAGASGIRLITNYSVTTKTATVTPDFAVAPINGQAFTITSGVVSPSFTGSLLTNDVCILPFTADNLVPFVYTGSLVSQQEMVCYEMELLNLVLPNQTLSVGAGSRTSFYQYVYVELSNVSGASAGNKNIIYSNNPNATRMVFRAAIDDVPNPIISSFIKIDGDGMVQTLKFKPNDNLKFSVHLSNGEVFDTIVDEFYSPSAPNPLIQVSACFSLKRV